jgi:hypothetical protein
MRVCESPLLPQATSKLQNSVATRRQKDHFLNVLIATSLIL